MHGTTLTVLNAGRLKLGTNDLSGIFISTTLLGTYLGTYLTNTEFILVSWGPGGGWNKTFGHSSYVNTTISRDNKKKNKHFQVEYQSSPF